MKRFRATEISEIATHKIQIRKQIDRCSEVFSSFNTAPRVINPYVEKMDYTEGSHDGKKIALSILALLALSESVLPKRFYERLKESNKFNNAFKKSKFLEDGKTKTSYKYLSSDPTTQFEGILEIWKFYKELLNALYSLPDFSDIQIIYTREDIDYENIQNLDEEEEIFT
jgi:hypothetical protein